MTCFDMIIKLELVVFNDRVEDWKGCRREYESSAIDQYNNYCI